MLTYNLQKRTDISLYAQLYASIKEDILSGTLAAHDKLPSKRAFAAHLGISIITVENAYDQLVAEGYVQSRPRQGFFVLPVARDRSIQQMPFQAQVPRNPQPRAIPQTQRPETAKNPLPIDLSSNALEGALFPFATWAKLMRQQMTHHQSALMQKTPSAGAYELRVALAQHLRSYRGMDVAPECIVVGAGSEYLHELIVALLGRTKRYAVEDPGYRTVTRIYQAQGVHCEHIGLNEKGLMLSELERRHVDVLHVSPSHHFPTGTTMSIAQRLELLAWATKRTGRFIVEDDYDSELRLKGRPIPALASIDQDDHVIYLNTFSKNLTPTIRIGYAVLPSALMDAYEAHLGFLANTVSTFEQLTLAAFIQQGYLERHINRLRTLYAARRDTVMAQLKKSPLAQRAHIIEKDAGLHFLLRIDGAYDDEKLIALLRAKGIALNALASYYHDTSKAPAHTFLINYSSLPESNIAPAFAALADAVSEAESAGIN